MVLSRDPVFVCLQYFVSSDVGGGKQQWYGFHKEPAEGKVQDSRGWLNAARRRQTAFVLDGHTAAFADS